MIHTDTDPLREFDVHFYYSMETRGDAAEIREKLLANFANHPIRISRMVDRPIGPHPLPMFEVNFKREYLEPITGWLKQNRGTHSVLIHEVTGDDFIDHSTGARWLGTPVELDFSQF